MTASTSAYVTAATAAAAAATPSAAEAVQGVSRPTSPVGVADVINSTKESLMGSASAATATATALAAAKSPQRDETAATSAPKELQDRRKSMSWKTFNLKRQLSKVNMKIGSSLNVNTELDAIRNSSAIFYTPKESSPEAATATATAEEIAAEALECREEDVGLATATAMLNCDTVETPATAATSTAMTTATPKRVDFEEPPESGERPNNLPLSETQQGQLGQGQPPLKPTRQKFKEKSRDQRLLSVPNIKYQPREQRSGAIGIAAGVGRANKNDVSPLMSGSLTKKIRKYACVKEF